MAQTEALVPPPQAPPLQNQGGGGGGIFKSLSGIIRMAAFWYFATKFFSPKAPPANPSLLMSNIFQRGEPMDMWLYLSEQDKFTDFGNEDALIWHETNIPYAVWGSSSSRSQTLKYYPSEALKHNGTLNAHVFFARSGYPPDPIDPEYDSLFSFSRTYQVVKYLPKSKDDKRKSLLGNQKGSSEGEQAPQDDGESNTVDEGPAVWLSYWKPNITINLVDDFTRYSQNGVPPNIAARIHELIYNFFCLICIGLCFSTWN